MADFRVYFPLVKIFFFFKEFGRIHHISRNVGKNGRRAQLSPDILRHPDNRHSDDQRRTGHHQSKILISPDRLEQADKRHESNRTSAIDDLRDIAKGIADSDTAGPNCNDNCRQQQNTENLQPKSQLYGLDCLIAFREIRHIHLLPNKVTGT